MLASMCVGLAALPCIAQPESSIEPGAPAPSEMHSPSLRVDHPLMPFSNFPGGEWRTELASGNHQRDVWHWGPGKHALTSITTNERGTSEAIFGSFRVLYHHPQRDELSVVALAGRDLIQTGTVAELAGGDLRFDMTLFYDQVEIPWAEEPTRAIASVWSFESALGYTNSWVEDQGQRVDPTFASWDYTKSDRATPFPPSADVPPGDVKHLGVFASLIGQEWESGSERVTFGWIPYNEAIRMRTLDVTTDELTAEAIYYPHPHTKAIHTIAIHDSGAVDEGIAVAEDGVIRIRSTRADQEGVTPIEQRIERTGSQTVRIQTWSLEGAERTQIADTILLAAPD